MADGCRCEVDPVYAVCRYCGQQIIWTRTRLGNRMPVDNHPSANGNVLLTTDPEGVICAEVIRWPTEDRKLLARCRHETHRVTCPEQGTRAKKARDED